MNWLLLCVVMVMAVVGTAVYMYTVEDGHARFHNHQELHAYTESMDQHLGRKDSVRFSGLELLDNTDTRIDLLGGKEATVSFRPGTLHFEHYRDVDDSTQSVLDLDTLGVVVHEAVRGNDVNDLVLKGGTQGITHHAESEHRWFVQSQNVMSVSATDVDMHRNLSLNGYGIKTSTTTLEEATLNQLAIMGVPDQPVNVLGLNIAKLKDGDRDASIHFYATDTDDATDLSYSAKLVRLAGDAGELFMENKRTGGIRVESNDGPVQLAGAGDSGLVLSTGETNQLTGGTGQDLTVTSRQDLSLNATSGSVQLTSSGSGQLLLRGTGETQLTTGTGQDMKLTSGNDFVMSATSGVIEMNSAGSGNIVLRDDIANTLTAGAGQAMNISSTTSVGVTSGDDVSLSVTAGAGIVLSSTNKALQLTTAGTSAQNIQFTAGTNAAVSLVAGGTCPTLSSSASMIVSSDISTTLKAGLNSVAVGAASGVNVTGQDQPIQIAATSSTTNPSQDVTISGSGNVTLNGAGSSQFQLSSAGACAATATEVKWATNKASVDMKTDSVTLSVVDSSAQTTSVTISDTTIELKAVDTTVAEISSTQFKCHEGFVQPRFIACMFTSSQTFATVDEVLFGGFSTGTGFYNPFTWALNSDQVLPGKAGTYLIRAHLNLSNPTSATTTVYVYAGGLAISGVNAVTTGTQVSISCLHAATSATFYSIAVLEPTAVVSIQQMMMDVTRLT